MRHLAPCLSSCIVLIMLAMPMGARGHGFQPEVVALSFSAIQPGVVHALTNNQGVFADLGGDYRWVCEDAVYPFATTQGLVLFGASEQRWWVATNHGLHLSEDGGCDFEAVAFAPLSAARLGGLWWHSTADALITATSEPSGTNEVFLSRDLGASWSPLGAPFSGVVNAFAWMPGEEVRFVLLTDVGLYRADVTANSVERLPVFLGESELTGEQLDNITLSPADQQRWLVLSTVGERTRAVLSADGGSSWRTVALFDDQEVDAVFSLDGQSALAVGASGGRWRSADAGETWAPVDPGPPAIGCLTRGPDGALYACSNPGKGGPWVLGRSEDFGVSWTPLLGRFEDAVHRKDCSRLGRTFQCCRGRCPGDALMCGQPTTVQWPAECYEGVPQLPDDGAGLVSPGLGVADDEVVVWGNEVGSSDIELAVVWRITDEPPPNSDSGGCRQFGQSQSEWVGLLLLGLLSGWGRRRQREG